MLASGAHLTNLSHLLTVELLNFPTLYLQDGCRFNFLECSFALFLAGVATFATGSPLGVPASPSFLQADSESAAARDRRAAVRKRFECIGVLMRMGEDRLARGLGEAGARAVHNWVLRAARRAADAGCSSYTFRRGEPRRTGSWEYR